VKPDGTNVVSSYSPVFPPQVSGISYGIPLQQTVTTLIASGALARVRVPLDGSLGSNWSKTVFDDSGWISAPTGIGYETDSGTFAPTRLADSVADFSGTQGANNWFYGYWDKKADGDGIYSDTEFAAFPNSGRFYGSRNFFYSPGNMWQWFGDQNIITALWANGGFPNGDNGDPTIPVHWAVRRYVAEASGNLRISGQIAHTNGWLTLPPIPGTYSAGFAPLLYIYLTGPGECYIDDLKLTDSNGVNLLANGDFEAPLTSGWTVSPNLAGSSITSSTKFTGSSSLHLVSTAAG